MSLISKFKPNGPSGFGYGSTAEEVTQGLDLSGKRVLITGSSSGLGQETLRVLALRGAHVIATARTLEKAERACRGVDGSTLPLACELSEPASVEACVRAVEQSGFELDAVICNAGIMALPRLEQVFGYEKQFFTNHIGHFLLVTRLLGRLAERGRVVMVSSDAHRAAPLTGIDFDNLSGERAYNAWRAYGQSKLANLLFAKHLAGRLPRPEQTANALHPGVIQTNLQRSMHPVLRYGMALGERLVLKTIPEGAATQCYVAVHPAATQNGEYFADCNVAKPRRAARNAELARKLWEVSERIVHDITREVASRA